MNEEIFTKCRLKLDYPSLIRLAALLGLCAGVLAIPFVLLLTSGMAKFNIVSVIFFAPLSGAVAGLLMAVLGYPLYSWVFVKLDGQVYSGYFQVIAGSGIGAGDKETAG
ncbi:MAG TPA: hypothetical protein ENI99_13025 [Sedimenticola sp.]|nr:hypothetical protein [Sedimenticola sp.]